MLLHSNQLHTVQLQKKQHIRHYILAFVLVVLTFCLYANLVRIVAQHTAQPVSALPTGTVLHDTAAAKGMAVLEASTQNTAGAIGGNTQQAATPVRAKIDVPQTCTGTVYALPAPLSLASASEGLTEQIDNPAYYEVYASNLAGLRKAITNCAYRAAVGDYHAVTSYQMNWMYTPTVKDGTCQLANVKVGLHVNQYFPSFSPRNTTSPEAASAWELYRQSLKTHEDGHIALDREYAHRLSNTLQRTGPMDCATLSRQVQTIIDSHVAMLNTANELYDTQTNHGATQGAAL